MKRKIINLSGAVSLVILLSGWGYVGHYQIASRMGESIGNKIDGFSSWISFIADHSSDADYRKSWDKSEFPKHYIDIDSFPEFNATRKICPYFDTLVARYGETFVVGQGTLPWSTMNAFDSLQHYFELNDWYRAKLWAADLCHYVSDGHMPLHTTSNYDGQFSGNKGIHARYESKMVTSFSEEITGEIKQSEFIKDVRSFIFDYLYKSNLLCDSILKADNRARQINGNTNSPEYLTSLWVNSAEMTKSLFAESSYALGSLIYTAWKQAGSPDLNSPGISTNEKHYDCEIESVIPVQVDTLLTINFQLFKAVDFKIDIRDSDGMLAMKVGSWEKGPGKYSESADLRNIESGKYMVILSCATYASSIQVIKK